MRRKSRRICSFEPTIPLNDAADAVAGMVLATCNASPRGELVLQRSPSSSTDFACSLKLLLIPILFRRCQQLITETEHFSDSLCSDVPEPPAPVVKFVRILFSIAAALMM